MNKTQIVVLSGAVLILVLLYFAPKINPSAESQQKDNDTTVAEDHSFESHITDFKKDLEPDQLDLIVSVEQALAQSEQNEHVILFDSLINLWDINKKPVAAAIYAVQKAEISPSAGHWFEAAERFFYVSRIVEKHMAQHAYEQAIRGYEEVLKTEPVNLDAKINLAVCYVESSREPMKGINLLREVLLTDSLNAKAHLNLGYFSLKSGQYDKAIARFEKVIQIDPTYVDAFLYLGDVYETRGNKKKAIEYYEQYRTKVNNPVLSQEIGNYIEMLKKNN